MKLPRLVSPIYSKELIQLALGWRLFICKCLVLIGLLAILGLAGRRQQDMAAVGQGVYESLRWLFSLAIVLAAPLLTAPAVAGERQANTLGLLLLTRLTPWQIAQDKGLARLTLLFFLVLLGLPFLAGAMLYGGVEPMRVAISATEWLTLALVCGGVSLYASAIAAEVWLAVLIGLQYEVVAIMLGGGFVVMARFFTRALLPGQPMWASVLVMLLLGPLIGLAVYLLGVRAAARTIREDALREPTPVLPPTPPPLPPPVLGTAYSRPTDPARLTLAQRLAAWPPVGSPAGNPLYWRFGRVTGLRAWMALLLGLAIVIGTAWGLLAKAFGAGGSDSYELIVMSLLPMMVTYVAVIHCLILPRERQGDTLAVLLSTRLTWRDFLLGHLRGPLRDLLAVGAVALPLLALCCTARGPGWVMVWGPIVSVLLTGTVLTLLGFRCALTAPTILRALITLAAVAGAVVWGLSLLEDYATRHRMSRWMWAFFPSTPLKLWDYEQSYYRWTPGRSGFKSDGWWMCLLLHWTTLAVIGGLLWLELRLRFDRLVGRQGEG